MAAQPKPKLYDPAAPENQYPKMVYPGEPKAGTGTIVNNKEEHDAFLAKQAPAAVEAEPEADADADKGDKKKKKGQ